MQIALLAFLAGCLAHGQDPNHTDTDTPETGGPDSDAPETFASISGAVVHPEMGEVLLGDVSGATIIEWEAGIRVNYDDAPFPGVTEPILFGQPGGEHVIFGAEFFSGESPNFALLVRGTIVQEDGGSGVSYTTGWATTAPEPVGSQEPRVDTHITAFPFSDWENARLMLEPNDIEYDIEYVSWHAR